MFNYEGFFELFFYVVKAARLGPGVAERVLGDLVLVCWSWLERLVRIFLGSVMERAAVRPSVIV